MQLPLLRHGKCLFVAMSLLFLLCALTVSSGVSPSALAHSTHPQATVYKSLTKGTLAPVAITDPRHPSVQTAAAIRPSRETNVVRRIPHPLTASAQTVGPVKSQAIPQARTGQILQNFNGVSSLDSENTNFGAEFEPPDQGLCVGNGFVIDAVNSAFTIYHSNGQPILGPLNINVLFAEGLAEFTSDPRCY